MSINRGETNVHAGVGDTGETAIDLSIRVPKEKGNLRGIREARCRKIARQIKKRDTIVSVG